jgi:superfamily I DNA/RNA helicase/RecB family exonuclease
VSSQQTIFQASKNVALPADSSPLLEILTSGQHAVIGAPGSGKTTLLRQVVRAIENLGVPPEEILVLTPSRLGASRLRDLLALDSHQASSGPRARSITSFAFMQQLGQNPDLKLFTGSQQQAVLRELIDSSPGAPWGFDRLTVSLQGFVQEVRDLLTICLEHQITVAELKAVTEKYPTSKLEVAIDLLPRYLATLKEKDTLDASQLVASSPAVTEAKYLLIDDAQDLSRAGLALIKRLAEGRNLVLFGDPDASVLGFRLGVSEGYLASFTDCLKHYLEPRSKFDLELAKFSSKLPPQLAGRQRHQGQYQAKVTAQYFLNQVAEADWLASEIRRSRLEQNLDFSQIAVVARTRTQLEQIAAQLSSRSVPVKIVGAQLALRDQYLARSILDTAQLAFGEPNARAVVEVLQSSVFGLDAIAVRRLTRQLAALEQFEGRTKDQLLLEALELGVEPTSFEMRKLNQLAELLRRIKGLADASAHELVTEIYRSIDSKKLQALARGRTEPAFAANRDLDAALELFAAAIRFDQREGGTASEFISQQLTQSVPEDSLAPIGLRDAVQLTTASQLIDQRFELVFIPRLQDGIWPNLRPRTSLLGAQSLAAFLDGRLESPLLPIKSELNDEIRLIYKAIGAANSKVYLSAMTSFEEQPSQFFEMLRLEPGLNQDAISFDLRRLVGEYRRRLAAGEVELAPKLASLALVGVPGAHPDQWQGLLPPSTSEALYKGEESIRFSPSRLDAFEACPLHWFIQNFGGDGSGFEASLGTLLHEALELARDEKELVNFVESNWHSLEFETAWQSTGQKRKALNMAAAIGEYLNQAGQLVQAEQKFELQIGRLQIVGKIDRVERDAEGNVQVVDLKTGKVPTQAQVDSHRQLAVYQLAMRQLGHEVTGGRIVAVGDQKLKVIQQQKLDGELESKILELLEAVSQGAGGSEFEASVSSHCSGDESCQILITKAVTHG